MKNKIETIIDRFIDNENDELENNPQQDEVKIKKDNSILERINKKILVEDNRYLLMD